MSLERIKGLIGTIRQGGGVLLVSTSVLGVVTGLLAVFVKTSSPVFFKEIESWPHRKRSPYIYVDKSSGKVVSNPNENGDNLLPETPLHTEEHSTTFTTAKVVRGKTNQKVYMPAVQLFQRFKAHQSNDARTLLMLSRSADPRVHIAAVVSMANTEDWTDADYLLVSQAIDKQTAVELARYPDVDLRFFRQPPPKAVSKSTARKWEQLKVILYHLSTNDMDHVTKYLTMSALEEGRNEESGAWCFGGVSLRPEVSHIEVPAEMLEKLFLEAIASHSQIAVHCRQMVKEGILPVLYREFLKRQSDAKLLRLVVQIVANISYVDDLHHDLFMSGWIRPLVLCSKHVDLEVATQAYRCLYNMDRVNEQHKLDSGVFVLHPQQRNEKPALPVADIIFIHGLLGGTFKTWRQTRSPASPAQYVNGKVNGDSVSFTSSWPKDWLPKDFHNVRILAVDYDSHLSTWSPTSQYQPEKQSIEARSKEIYHKLKTAGVGTRPIIMIGHSMGGLLVKEMLVNHVDFSRQAVGCIFYGTPHFGSPLADSSSQGISRRVLSPSTEVTELKTDSPALLTLHMKFKELCSKMNLACLSFGETQKTSVGLNVQLNIVPLQSSDPGVGEFFSLDCNHLDVCKPSSRHSHLYQRTRIFIQRCISRIKPRDNVKDEEFDYCLLY